MDGRIAIDGVSLAYTVAGTGPPVVLLHGWCCNRRFWRAQIPALARACRVLALDFRGHGESDAPGHGYTLERLAEDIYAAMAGVGVLPATLVGHSMGGMVAQRLALNHPDSVSTLVLVATTAADPDDTLLSKRILEDTPALAYAESFARHVPGWFSADGNPELSRWVKTQMVRVPERVALALVRDYKNLDYRRELPSVRVPTLVIGATSDVSTPAVRSGELAALIPKSELLIIEGAGHFVQLERPQEVNAALSAFLSKHGVRRP